LSIILLVDAQSVYRRGIKQLIENGIAHSHVREASQLQRSDVVEPVDLILIDAGCFDPRSGELLQDANDRNPGVRRAILSASKNRRNVLNCLSAGFHGYVHKLQPDSELLTAISDLLSGRIYVPSWLAHDQDKEINFETLAYSNLELENPKLTRRQNEIVALLAKGMSNKEIARELNIAEGTTKVHATALLRALGARNRTEAAFLAAKLVGASGIRKSVSGHFVSLAERIEEPRSPRGKIR
jgi:DNA-binding NarL/FixJ family response regulator